MKTCFVISPIGEPGSEEREHADDVFDFIIKPAAERAGYVAKRADHDARPGIISEHMYDSILSDDLIIGVLTFHNPNVFYEIAIAEAAARPLILLIERGQHIPFDIHDRRVLSYDLKPRSLLQGEHAETLAKAIAEQEASPVPLKVPFRPSLRPLGSGEAGVQIVPRAEDVPRESIVSFVQEARSHLWFQGIALFTFPKIVGFADALRAALNKGVEVRVLLMHPDNPALQYVLRDFAPNYVEMVRSEIQAGAAFWTGFANEGSLTVRFHTSGAMFANTMQTDQRIVWTQYSLARSTSESPTIIAPAGVPFYNCNRQDFEWSWTRAAHEHSAEASGASAHEDDQARTTLGASQPQAAQVGASS